MANKKKDYYKPGPMTEGKRNIIQGLLQEYNIESAADIQEALKDLLGGTIKEMMEAEMDDHLGYEKCERSNSDDARNGYKSKRITTSYGGMEIEVPQDRKSTFEPKVVKKRQKDISEIDQKIISMYAKGMTTRQISDTLMDSLYWRPATCSMNAGSYAQLCKTGSNIGWHVAQIFVDIHNKACSSCHFWEYGVSLMALASFRD